jgi:phosphoribosyl 1,2-cyclic phosphodiesterase
LCIECDGRILVVDCGIMFPDVDMPGIDLVLPDFTYLRDNADRVEAILLTHAHEDHAGGLRGGSPCPVFGTAATLGAIARFGVAEHRVVERRTPFRLGGLRFEAFPVEHSLRAPAVGYRVTSNGTSLFYAPDLVEICDRADALAGIELYVGDGASLRRGIIRTRDGARIGHASIREQLGWCAAEAVPRAIFTHCGSQIVRADGRTSAGAVRRLGRAAGVEAAIARDGLRLELEALATR